MGNRWAHWIVTLSRVSNYCLSDWLAVFGFHLDQITKLQPLFPRKHTVFLDSSVYDENAWVPSFGERTLQGPIPSIAPVAQLLLPGAAQRAKEIIALRKREYLYARVGEEDLLSFPELLPGSIVRIDPLHSDPSVDIVRTPSRQIFLVEHENRLYCGRLQRIAKHRPILSSSHFPFAYIDLGDDSGARIHGVVDAELRSLISVTRYPSLVTENAPLKGGGRHRDAPRDLRQLLRFSRMRTGLSFREASSVSQRIAHVLGDERYFAAPGTFSDYETLTQPPRQVHKIISLCIVYCIRFWDFVRAAGLEVELTGGDPIPDELMPRLGLEGDAFRRDSRADRSDEEGPGILARLVDEWKEIPLFAMNALAHLSGLKALSMSNIFWVGGNPKPIYPYLGNAAFVVVNRRSRKPGKSTTKMLWEQPLYMLLLRDGRFLCGACTLQDDVLFIHPYPDRSFVLHKLRDQIDAEVIGQVAAIVRSLA